MTREELLLLHATLASDSRLLLGKKNADYANGDDPFLNFRASQNYNVHPAKGILIRMSDKMSRINSYIERGNFEVRDEGLRDTAIDIINYTVLLVGLLEENIPITSEEIKDYIHKRYDQISNHLNSCNLIDCDCGAYHPNQLVQYEERKNANGSTWNKEKTNE